MRTLTKVLLLSVMIFVGSYLIMDFVVDRGRIESPAVEPTADERASLAGNNNSAQATETTSRITSTPRQDGTPSTTPARIIVTVTVTAQATTTASQSPVAPAPTSAPSPSPTATATPRPALPPTQPPATPTPPPAPTAGPAPTIQPSPTLPPAAAMLDRVEQARKALREGRLEATINFGDDSGSQSTAQLAFRFGSEDGPAQMQVISTYQTGDSSQVNELVMIGTDTWQRQSDGPWSVASAPAGIGDQVNSYLPQTDSVTELTRTDEENHVILHWFDTARNNDVVLRVDPATGTPLTMQVTSRNTGSVTMITYSGWNVGVEIPPPEISS